MDHDVVIIGAGPAGLAAAASLRDCRVLVLEREPAPGGRVATMELAGLCVDLGACFAFRPTLLPEAAWNDRPDLVEERAPIEALVGARLARAELGIGCVEELAPDELSTARRLQAASDASIDRAGPLLRSLFALIHPGDMTRYAPVRQRDALAPWYPDHWESGNGLLIERLAAYSGAEVRCGAIAREVLQGEDRVEVRWDRGGVEERCSAEAVIVATPADAALALLGGALAPDQRAFLSRVSYGRYTVAAFVFADAEAIPDFRFRVTPDGPLSFVMQQRSADRRKSALLCYFNEDASGRLDGLSDEGVVTKARHALIEAGVIDAAGLARAEVALRRWRIAGTILTSEFLDAARRVSPRVGARVVLAGDYISGTEGWGYGLDDAVASGERAAAAVRASR